MKKTKKCFAGFLAALIVPVILLMMFAVKPLTVEAGTGSKTLQHWTSGIAAGDRIYFGNYTEGGKTYYLPWQVMEDGIIQKPEADGALSYQWGYYPLLSQYTLGTSAFAESGSGIYSGSTLQAAMDARYAAFEAREREEILDTTLPGAIMSGGESGLTSQKLFPVSKNAADSLDSSVLTAKSVMAPEGSSANWWLCTSFDDSQAYAVNGEGSVNSQAVDSGTVGVRPAFNLNLGSVLFTSAAEGGKTSGTVGAGALTQLSEDTTDEWKLTLKDSTKNSFNVSADTLAAKTTGGTVSISYSGAVPGENEYLSAILVDNAGNFLFYGRLKNIASSADSAGTQDITVPSGLFIGTFTLRLFNEEYNGDKKTDYSSALRDVTLKITEKLATPANPVWDAEVPGRAVWDEVENYSTYSIQLYKDGTALGSAATVMGRTNYDFMPAMKAAGEGSYTFQVTAIGDVINYTDSDPSALSGIYSYPPASKYDEIMAGGVYTFHSVLDEAMVLDISGASYAQGANLQLWKSNKTSAQKFIAIQKDNGYWEFAPYCSGRVLDICGAAALNGTNVQQFTENGTQAQEWEVRTNADGTVTFGSRLGNFVLDIAGGQTSEGTNVRTDRGNDTAAQKFIPEQVGTVPYLAGRYSFSSALDSGLTLDIAANVRQNGTNIQLYAKNGTKAQEFYLAYGRDGAYRIVTGDGFAVDVAGASKAEGTNVQLYESNYTAAQNWFVIPNSDGTLSFRSACNDLCMDVECGRTANGTNVQCWPENGTAAQRWKLA